MICGLARKNDMKDGKIPGEECVLQHKLVVMDVSIKRSTKKKAKGLRGRLKTWKLRSAAGREEFECEVGKIMVQGKTIQERWNSLEHGLKKWQRKYVSHGRGAQLFP